MTDRTHHHDVARPILDRAKEAEDDYNYVEEVGEDRGPLVAQEVKDLSFQSQNLERQETKKEKETNVIRLVLEAKRLHTAVNFDPALGKMAPCEHTTRR